MTFFPPGSLVKLSDVFSADWIAMRGIGLVLNVNEGVIRVHWFKAHRAVGVKQTQFYLVAELEPVDDNEN